VPPSAGGKRKTKQNGEEEKGKVKKTGVTTGKKGQLVKRGKQITKGDLIYFLPQVGTKWGRKGDTRKKKQK